MTVAVTVAVRIAVTAAVAIALTAVTVAVTIVVAVAVTALTVAAVAVGASTQTSSLGRRSRKRAHSASPPRWGFRRAGSVPAPDAWLCARGRTRAAPAQTSLPRGDRSVATAPAMWSGAPDRRPAGYCPPVRS